MTTSRLTTSPNPDQNEVSETDIIPGLSTAQVSKIRLQKRPKDGTRHPHQIPSYGVTLHPPVAGSHIAVIAINCELVECLSLDYTYI
jgi:hypothetical protein